MSDTTIDFDNLDAELECDADVIHCRSPWCEKCKCFYSKKIYEKLKDWDYKRTYHIVLTCDPKLFSDGKEAYEYVRRRKHIVNLVRNLTGRLKFREVRKNLVLELVELENVTSLRDIKRRTNIENTIKYIDKQKEENFPEVERWLWILEFHRSGFPHWHLLINMSEERTSKGGFLNYTLIYHLWGIGGIKDNRINDQEHWNEISGYFRKHGYFDKKKGFQSRLPEWGINSDMTIRKYGYSIEKKTSNFDVSSIIWNIDNYSLYLYNLMKIFDGIKDKDEEQQKLITLRVKKTYAERINRCGNVFILKVRILIDTPVFEFYRIKKHQLKELLVESVDEFQQLRGIKIYKSYMMRLLPEWKSDFVGYFLRVSKGNYVKIGGKEVSDNIRNAIITEYEEVPF